jgi:hypothetical protein
VFLPYAAAPKVAVSHTSDAESSTGGAEPIGQDPNPRGVLLKLLNAFAQPPDRHRQGRGCDNYDFDYSLPSLLSCDL